MWDVSAKEESCCVYVKPPKIMQHYSVGRYIFYCWADSIVHLLLLKSSMVKHKLGNNLFHAGLSEALGTFEENGKLGSATANRR